jgi:hypothetical protein
MNNTNFEASRYAVFLRPPYSLTFSIIGLNIILSTLLSDTLDLSSSLQMRDYASHLYKVSSKIIILCHNI